jgi:hypothetical protein
MRFTGITLASAVGGLVLTLGAPASASGTLHYDYPEQCYDFYEYTVCSSVSGQYNQTETPSGNLSAQGKGKSRYSVTAPGYSYSSDFEYKYHFLLKQGETHQQSSKSTTFTKNGQACTYTEHFHFANGQVQFNRPEVNCS